MGRRANRLRTTEIIEHERKVHMAMLSRGFNEEVKIMQDFKARTRDYIAGASAVSLSLLLALIAATT
jgi:cobalt/nickel transport system permease protein